MEKLVYAWYPIIAIVLLWGSKFYGKQKWNEEFLTLRQTKQIQGFLAICILFHHAGQKTCASWIPPQVIVPGLEFFVPIGYLFVAFFLFCSGYGLYKSVHAKENYLSGFVKKRVIPVVAAFYVTAIFFLLLRLVMGQQMDAAQIIRYLVGIQLANPNAWYVIAIPLFYMGFYLSFRFCKKEGAALLGTSAVVLLYIIIGIYTDHNDYLMCGEWWYNTAHMFLIGILFAKYENNIIESVKKHYLPFLIASVLAALLFFRWSEMAQSIFSYYGENWGAPDKIFRPVMCLTAQQVASAAFVWAMILVHLKVRVGNFVLRFMGTITLEFYLIHGAFVEMFGYSFLDITPSLYYIENVALYLLVLLACALPSAYLLHKFMNVLCYGKRKREN